MAKEADFWGRLGGKCALAAILLHGSWAVGADLPDSKLNSSTGFVETVGSYWSGSSFDIRHIVDPGPGSSTVTVLASLADHERNPRIEIDTDFDTWVTYWRIGTTHEVLVRRYDAALSSWSSELTVSASSVDSRRPSVAYFESAAWVAYETDEPSATGIELGRIVDDFDPLTRFLVGTTTFVGAVDVEVFSESGSLWVTWVDSSTVVGWAEFDSSANLWSTPAYESYSNDGIELARKRIRDEVLGL